MSIAHYIWFEKYRPSSIRDLSLTKEHKTAFKQFLKEKQVPHLLLEGPQGSGKTTIGMLLIDNIPCVHRIFNASGEDRGVGTMKGAVKNFAASQPPKGKIKIILLDEADHLTPDAQASLRNTIETYSKSCRFILTCNYIDKIIPPLQSRCMRFTFERFPKDKVVVLCNKILKSEKIKGVDQDKLYELVDRFYPDIRSVVNNLQAACLSGSFNINAIDVLNVNPEDIAKYIKQGSVLSLRKALAGTTSFTFIYKYLFDVFIESVDDDVKAEVALAVAESLVNDAKAPDREINFVGCCLMIMDAMSITPNFKK